MNTIDNMNDLLHGNSIADAHDRLTQAGQAVNEVLKTPAASVDDVHAAYVEEGQAEEAWNKVLEARGLTEAQALEAIKTSTTPPVEGTPQSQTDAPTRAELADELSAMMRTGRVHAEIPASMVIGGSDAKHPMDELLRGTLTEKIQHPGAGRFTL
ncbi:hypothetical protein [Propionimicrobium sp. PCR01-08-3]|uniref:hypothetical protein n=1 Tax=Propionimicrobium sp. PCR01-08-3 TaxID=3052086 RepID=UPI00255CE6D8|nr:hypothetical protein [Propionimicrobium sp. PCR01-08-3]WIY82583.1 hypothetical protein QQ658_13935 [Propionimicrobium sp. PCR01-08-3]